MNTGLTNLNVRSLTFFDKNIFVATNDGVFLSTDNDTSWTAVNTGLTNLSVTTLTVSDAYLFAGIHYNGVWRRPLSEMVTAVEDKGNNVLKKFSLSQNYPNPFNPSTNISFSLPSKSFVSLVVYDVTGRKVATIISEDMSAGNYTRQWNAQGLSSGIYFYRLQAGNFTETKKLVLLQ